MFSKLVSGCPFLRQCQAVSFSFTYNYLSHSIPSHFISCTADSSTATSTHSPYSYTFLTHWPSGLAWTVLTLSHQSLCPLLISISASIYVPCRAVLSRSSRLVSEQILFHLSYQFIPSLSAPTSTSCRPLFISLSCPVNSSSIPLSVPPASISQHQ